VKSILMIALTAATSTAAWSFAILGTPVARGVGPPPTQPHERQSPRGIELPASTLAADTAPDVAVVETRAEAPSVCAFEFHGRVVDACGRAIENFAITAIHRDSNNRFLERREWPLEAHIGGRFELPELGPGYWDFAPSAPGLALERIRSFRASTSSPVDFVLRGAVTVRGIVLGPDGRPVAGAALRPHLGEVDADGRFVAETGVAEIRLRAVAEGFRDSVEVVIEPCQRSGEIELVLERP
jgi:hypothetical protein